MSSFVQQPDPVPLDVLYKDEEIIAVNKPAGLLVHRSRIDVYATEFAVQKIRDQIGRQVFLVHRLDRPTSGVLLLALNAEVARQLAIQFAQRQVSKSYRAIVRGYTAKAGRCDDPLQEKHDRISDQRAKSDKLPQAAITEYNTLRRWEVPFSAGKYLHSRYSEVSITPLTGRKHQIRRHFNHLAHPIIGDSSHGDRRHNRLFREQLQVSRLLLVANRLTFQHPTTKQTIKLEANLGTEFEFAMQQLDRFSI